jgi:gamma-glutamyltranspeptidase/glutathione hydrolase
MQTRSLTVSRLAVLLVGMLISFSALSTGCAPADSAVAGQQAGQTARSPRGMVVTAHPLATEAGVEMLASGGNAVDAAVAAAFALAVVEPSMSGLGGRAQVLLLSPDGSLHGIDGTTQAPPSMPAGIRERTRYGYRTVGVPGVVAALTRLHSEHGSLPLSEVIAPAIRYAEGGFPLLVREAVRFAASAEQLREFAGSRRYFLKADGSPYKGGEQFVQADLGATLRRISERGADVFYRGAIADSIEADMGRNGGFVTAADMAAYETVTARIVRGGYRGYDLAGTGIPAAGATIIEALQIMEHFPLDEMVDHEWAIVTAQAIRLARMDMGALRGSAEERERQQVSPEQAALRAAEIRLPGAADPPPTERFLLEPVSIDGHTTHLSTADRNGGMVALTQSLGPSVGSRVATPGLGFLYAVTLGGYLGPMEPGQRAASNIAPFMVLHDGRGAYALGAAGGSLIPTAIIEVLSRSIDQNRSLADAMAQPRIHPAGRSVRVESLPGIAWSESELAAIEAFGLTPERGGAIARIHAVRFDAQSGEWVGVADPRWQGTASGPGGG